MPVPWVRGFIWDDENLAHIARHGVSPDEVEEALVKEPLVLRDPTSATSPMAHGAWPVGVRRVRDQATRRVRVLTARDMTERERRLYQRKRRGRS
jgi:uncharacterized protein